MTVSEREFVCCLTPGSETFAAARIPGQRAVRDAGSGAHPSYRAVVRLSGDVEDRRGLPFRRLPLPLERTENVGRPYLTLGFALL